MQGTYSIVKVVAHPAKFACYVKFNEELYPDFYTSEAYPEGGEYFEVDSTDPDEVASVLQETADREAAEATSEQEVSDAIASIEIVEGKIVTK